MQRLLFGSTLVLSLFAACGPYKPTHDDAGSNTNDAATAQDTSTACVADYQSCNVGSKCCTPGYVCNPQTTVCQANCVPINGLCSDNSNCCSGICNGVCQ